MVKADGLISHRRKPSWVQVPLPQPNGDHMAHGTNLSDALRELNESQTHIKGLIIDLYKRIEQLEDTINDLTLLGHVDGSENTATD